MDVKNYLTRIGFSGKTDVNLITLERLQRCHLSSVPFENLDIFLGKKLTLDLESSYHQVVECHRGGWCYQLNSLFCWLLRELGFTVDMVCGRTWTPSKRWSRKFAHMVLVAHLEGERYMVDVAWGGQPRNPLKPVLIKEEEVTDMANASIRMMREDDFWYCQVMEGDRSWQNYFSFYLEPVPLEDFQDMSDKMQQIGWVLGDWLLIGIKDFGDDTLWHFINFRKYEKIRSVCNENKVVVEIEEDLNVERLGSILREKFGIVLDLTGMDEKRWQRSSTQYNC